MAAFSTTDRWEAWFRSGAQGYRISPAIFGNIWRLLGRAGFQVITHKLFENWKKLVRRDVEIDVFFIDLKDGSYTFCWMPPTTGWNGVELDLIFFASHAEVFVCPGSEVYVSAVNDVDLEEFGRHLFQITEVPVDFSSHGVGVELSQNVWLRYGPALALDTCEDRVYIALDIPRKYFRRYYKAKRERMLMQIWRLLFQFRFLMVGRYISSCDSLPFGFKKGTRQLDSETDTLVAV